MELEDSTNLVRKLSFLFIGIFVTFSGFCSLVYQVVWDRTLRYNFGGDSISSAIVTATFLLGLGIGAFVFGKWRKRAFMTYALVEMGIGAYAITSYYILAPLATTLGRVFSYSISDAEGLRYIVVAACILFLLPPCTLMGGTLPLIFNCFIRPGTYKNKTVGMLYGLNTAGASIGILAAPFLFLNHISIPSTLLVVGTGSILLGIVVWLYGRTFSPYVGEDSDTNEVQAATHETNGQLPLLPLLALSFISGFISLSFEISLFRTVGLLAQMSPYTFPIVLMPFLLAMALGSMLSTRFREYSPTLALGRIGVLFISAMLGVLGGILIRYFFAFNLLLIVPLPLLLGGVFPLLLRLASSKGKELPGRTGMIYLSNSVGSFVGAMLSQFYGFPHLGTKGLIISLYLIGLLTGTLCLIWIAPKSKTPLFFQAKHLAAVTALSLALVPLLIPAAMWDIYTFGYTGPNVDRVEGVSGVATINWEPNRRLGHVEINGTYMSALPDHPKHVRLAGVALSMPQRENVLFLGLGGGGMVRELVKDPEIKRLDIIDWSHELPLLLESPRAKEMLEGALHSPKVRLFRCDARVAVSLYEEQSFDMVIDNLAMVGWAGSTSIKSVTYFREINRILKPTGVFVFSPNYIGSPAREAVLAGLVENFQYVQEHETAIVVLASSLPVEIDRHRAEEVLEDRGEVLGLSPPYADWLLQGFKPITVKDLKNTPPIVDELLVYEYTLFGKLHRAR
jgi:spermidine synthase